MQESIQANVIDFNSELLSLTNAQRSFQLKEAPDLKQAAALRAAHFCGNPLSHNGWRDSFVGLPYAYVGENLAQGYETASSVEAAFISSREHEENISSTEFQYVGIAQRCNTVVELFGGY